MPFSLNTFDIDIIQYPHMIQIENKQSVQIDTHYNFTDKDNTYELRYTLFSQIENNVQSIRDVFTVFSIMIIRNIAGYDINLSNFVFFNDNDVKKEFNGDFGITGFIQNPASDYGNGYKYILLEIFCKNNTGIVVRTILSNDINRYLDMDSIEYDEIYHSFKFRN
jgi:hypothetical protein